MFAQVTGVRPRKVCFLNRFLHLSDKRLLTVLIKKIITKTNFRVQILALKNAFFGGFENDNISSA